MSRVMRGVYRGLLSFVTRTVFLAALLLPLSYSARPEPSGAPRAPEVRLALDPDWAARVDAMIDRGDHEGLRLDDARAVPVLIDRLLQDGRGDPAARTLERIFESHGVTDEEGEPLRIRPRSARQHDLLARWYLDNRRKMEGHW